MDQKKMVVSLLPAILLLLVVCAPLRAAEQTFVLTIPGCGA